MDTNFINFSIRNKMDIVRSMMDCLLAKCIPCITDCVMGELEKLGAKYAIALKLAKDPRFERIPCNCKGCYADDCMLQMAKQWRCFIIATCDKELRNRIRKIPGVPSMYITNHKYTVERMPEGMFFICLPNTWVNCCKYHLINMLRNFSRRSFWRT